MASSSPSEFQTPIFRLRPQITRVPGPCVVRNLRTVNAHLRMKTRSFPHGVRFLFSAGSETSVKHTHYVPKSHNAHTYIGRRPSLVETQTPPRMSREVAEFGLIEQNDSHHHQSTNLTPLPFIRVCFQSIVVGTRRGGSDSEDDGGEG